jgi:phage terminase small subunit
LTGNPSKRSMRPPIEPAREPQPPEPLGFLSAAAADEWRRVAPALWADGLLTVLDHAVLAAYCQMAARWEEAEAALARGDGPAAVLRRVSRQAAADMVSYGGHFGLTPRTRQAGGPPPGGKFGELLA